MSAKSFEGGSDGIGYFGKIPSHGDFITRGLPQSFIDPWDQWLRAAITKSRQQLGDSWLSHYLTGPLYQFALSPGLCGEPVWAGVLMPSVDAVGRYYSLVISASRDPNSNPFSLLTEQREWFSSLGRLALTCLNDNFNLERFHDELREKQLQIPDNPSTNREAVCPTNSPSFGAWRFANDTDNFSIQCPIFFDYLPRDFCSTSSVWSTRGSEKIKPCWLICKGLPAYERMVAMLDGKWRKWGWSCNESLAEKAGGAGQYESTSTWVIPKLLRHQDSSV